MRHSFISYRLALIQNAVRPSLARRSIVIFCADHGVSVEGVSAYPREVTAQMVANFAAGGAAISVLARQLRMEAVIVDCGVDSAAAPHGVRDLRLGRGTRNMAVEPAMTVAEARQAIANGEQLARELAQRFDIVATGEMGIGNTTAASALLCAFTGMDASQSAGPGTGLAPAAVSHKAGIIRRALQHVHGVHDPLAILAAVGGFEIATMTGFLVGAAKAGLPVLVDGFISSAAALAACALEENLKDYLIFSHMSAST